MRRTLTPALLGLLLLAGCGSGSESLTPAERVRAAADTTSKTSSRVDLLTVSHVQGQDFTIKGQGLFDFAGGEQRGTMTMTVGPTTLKERMIDGVLYLQPPGDTFFYSIAMKDLAGTSLSESSDPTSAAALLAAMGDDVAEVGEETLHGDKTTHYRGTIPVAKAKELAENDLARKSVQKLIDGGVTTIPADVWLDDKGRLRRLVEDIALTVQGVKAQVKTQLDIYDFGVKVDVEKPPASQIKDGAQILDAIKSQLG